MNLEEQIKETLKGVNYPGYSRDIVSFGLVKGVAAANGSAGIDLELTTHNPEVAAQLKAECEAAVKVLDGIARAMVQVKLPPALLLRRPSALLPRRAGRRSPPPPPPP